MEKFVKYTGLVAPLDRANVDTDQIIPKQFLKSIKRTGFGPNLFDEWRYLDEGPGQDNGHPDFVLNKPRYQGASVLLTRRFGCGSSREHLGADGFFRAIIAPSYADIFYKLLQKRPVPIVLPKLPLMGFQAEAAAPVSAHHRSGESAGGDPGRRGDRLRDRRFANTALNGLDEIGLTLQQADAIRDRRPVAASPGPQEPQKQ